MEKNGRYYLGRVIKINLSQTELMNAIISSPIITKGKFDWTITDCVDARDNSIPFVYGKLSKYAKDGHANVVDEGSRSQIKADVPNLVEASSPFIYLPEFSGIAYLHVWNGIQEDVFPRRFKSIVEEVFGGFMISCEIDPLSDYTEFTQKLRNISTLTEISGTVSPPNPLFGRLWGELNDYISKRNASEVTVKESSSKLSGIKSKLIELMDGIMKSKDYVPETPADIGDAVILMAADGYGRGKVSGISDDGEEVVIKTSDTQKSFLFPKDPNPYHLAVRAKEYFAATSIERDMKH
ncbi:MULTISPECIES: hypothetical protein [Aeromonas]|uniref:DUF4747 family protein n=3 Tax=Aeromonadaceae TaxID=84642 RepID=A0A6S4T745_AERCA|nr:MULTISPECIES: hypothetical protein [Aeromonas]EGX6959886.1 hypothetical protein [Aeromonas hydrophila]MBS4717858.1 hypothetical protein [Aeromonas dhakensis]MCA4701413.1 hypothetical protein [Aeromonas hydrophila]QIO20513.1 hypothetical protein G9455_22770 [Aeromonas hydrophila]UUT50426.1 hypothetical protein MOO39_22315 [Aeromonas hydrophila]